MSQKTRVSSPTVISLSAVNSYTPLRAKRKIELKKEGIDLPS